jgi:hypothetical protein
VGVQEMVHIFTLNEFCNINNAQNRSAVKKAFILIKYADTALRDIKDLIEKGILKQEESGGRSTNYEFIEN